MIRANWHLGPGRNEQAIPIQKVKMELLFHTLLIISTLLGPDANGTNEFLLLPIHVSHVTNDTNLGQGSSVNKIYR